MSRHWWWLIAAGVLFLVGIFSGSDEVGAWLTTAALVLLIVGVVVGFRRRRA